MGLQWLSRRREARRVRCLLQQLALPSRPRLADLLHQLEELRGRPVVLVPSFLRGLGLSGVWLDIGDRDLIAYESTVSSRLQRYIVCHEIGHIMMGHSPLGISQLVSRQSSVTSDGESAVSIPAFYDASMEIEAEAVARWLLRNLTFGRQLRGNVDLQTVSGRITATLQRR